MKLLQQEVIVPIKICKKKSGSHTYFMNPKDYYVVTPLSKLLAKAYVMEKRLRKNPELLFKDFCKLNNISRQYLSAVLQLNRLSPKIKRLIMEGYLPKHLSIQSILRAKIPLLWKDQEKWFIGWIFYFTRIWFLLFIFATANIALKDKISRKNTAKTTN